MWTFRWNVGQHHRSYKCNNRILQLTLFAAERLRRRIHRCVRRDFT